MTGIAAATAPIVNIDIVICTYNRAANLDEVLSALSAQRVGSDVIWSVLVVDNASTDATAEVVEAHRFHRLLPSLRRVVESEPHLLGGAACRKPRHPGLPLSMTTTC
jgi:GT2 family glycosyltransferase